MKGRVTVYIGIVEQVCRASGGEGEENLEASVVPAAAGLNDSVASSIVPPGNAFWAVLTQQVHNLGVACRTGYHKGSLLVFIQTNTVGFVAESEERTDDREVAQFAREV
jgi:hypothetical protein